MEIRVMVAKVENGWLVEVWAYHPRRRLHQRFMAYDNYPELVALDI